MAKLVDEFKIYEDNISVPIRLGMLNSTQSSVPCSPLSPLVCLFFTACRPGIHQSFHGLCSHQCQPGKWKIPAQWEEVQLHHPQELSPANHTVQEPSGEESGSASAQDEPARQRPTKTPNHCHPGERLIFCCRGLMLLDVHGWGGKSVNVLLKRGGFYLIFSVLDFGAYVMIFLLCFRSRI